MSRDLSRLLRPKSIAVIGGGAWCAHVVRNCRKLGFRGPVWPVHPRKPEIAGEAAYRSIADLPQAPDAAFVGVNRTAAVDVVRALADGGAGGAVVYASGFREAAAETADGGDLQQALRDAAGRIVLIGPNCYGFLNFLDGAGLWPDQQGGARVESGVAIVTQSSNIAINLTMQRRGLPLAFIATAGNQAQTGLAEIAAALLEDRRVTALGLHVEGVGDLRALETLSRLAQARGVPVVVLKTGATEASRAASVSHTASLAGSDAGAAALLNRLGFARVTSLGVLLETLKLLHLHGPLGSGRIASASCSGGEAGLVADAAARRGLEFPLLGEAQRARLRAVLGPRVALANPLDYHTYIWGDVAAMQETYLAMLGPEVALGLVVADFPREDRCSAADWEPVIVALGSAARAAPAPMALLSSLAENIPEAAAERLMALGVAPLAGIEDGLDAVAAAAWLGRERTGADPLLLPRPAQDPRMLSEAEGKAALAAHGLDVPTGQRCASAAELARAARALRIPLVLKAEGVAHKTEAGAVALGLRSQVAVRDAARAMAGEGWLLEEMVAGGVAELLLGVVLDPAHGYVLTLGAGGTLAEVMQDSVSLLLPVGAKDIAAALRRLRLAPLLAGYRGAPAADGAAIVRAVLAVQAYVTANHGRVEEVEINPLICTPDRAVAADVLIWIGDRHD